MIVLNKFIPRKQFVIFSIGTAIFVIFSFFPFNTSYAQSTIGITELTVSPQYPGPFENISLSIESSQIDLNRATISWTLDGEVRKSEIGKTQVLLRTGDVGTIYRVTASIEALDGTVVNRSVIIRPANVDLVWAGNSYTPPFYKGKALPPSAGNVSITAVPNLVNGRGDKLDPNSLVYTWLQNGVVLGNASGYGKQRIVLENGSVSQRRLVVTVRVANFENTIFTEKTIRVPVSDTILLLYEKHPLEGVQFNRSIGKVFSFSEEEVTLSAQPFFFSLDDIANGLVLYRWKLNGVDIQTPLGEQSNETTFRRDDPSAGQAILSVSAENYNSPFRVLQEAFKDIRIDLGS